MSTYVANTDGDKTTSGYKTKSANMSKNEAGSSLNMSVQWSERIYEKQKRPTLRNSHNVCSDSKHKNMYLFGGRSKGGSNNHLYSLSNDSLEKGWELIECNGTIPAPRKSATLVYCAGYLYLFGGNYKEQLLADFYAFRIDKKNWMQIKAKGTAPQARDRHTMCVLDNKIYVFGGHTQDSEFCNDLYMYDPKINTWSEIKASMSPTARYEHVCVSIGNLLVVAGGKCKKGGLADIWSFDTKSNNPKWIQPIIKSTNKRDPRWGQSCVTFNKYILLFGGWNGRFCFNDVTVIDTKLELNETNEEQKNDNNSDNQTWETLNISVFGTRPSIRTFHGASILANNMIVVAGRNMTKRLNDTYTLDLSDLAPGGMEVKMSIQATADLQNNLPTPEHISKLHADSKKKKINLQSFKLAATLGTGSFGRVRLVQYKPSKEYFAMKMLRKTRVVEMKQENHIKWEKKILSSIRHPFIVNLEASFQDKYFLYLILEVVSGGEFFTLLRRTGTLKLPHAAFYASQIVLVFQFLHKNHIVYRDLKPENLLIGSDGYLRLTDFGFAKRLEKPYRTWTLCGTPEYIAPEILLNRGHNFSVDWWALGILLFEMFTGNPPFCDENPMKIYQKILDGKIDYPRSISSRGKDFIGRLLNKNVSHRLGNLENGAVDVMKHPFFEGVNWRSVLEKKVRAPYYPQLDNEYDTKHFDKYDEDTDTEDQEIENDPFLDDF